MKRIMTMLLAASLPMLAAAAPPGAEDRADVRCLVVAYHLAGNEDKEISQAGILISQYYLGRLDGRSPGLDLEAAIEAETKGMDDAQMKALLERCGAEVEKRGKDVEALGTRLEKKGI